MAVQERPKHHHERETEQASSTKTSLGSKTQKERGEELKKEIDDLLDEIDGVLEEDAEMFVKAYVQKGGE